MKIEKFGRAAVQTPSKSSLCYVSLKEACKLFQNSVIGNCHCESLAAVPMSDHSIVRSCDTHHLRTALLPSGKLEARHTGDHLWMEVVDN